MQVMPGVSLRARWDATLVHTISLALIYVVIIMTIVASLIAMYPVVALLVTILLCFTASVVMHPTFSVPGCIPSICFCVFYDAIGVNITPFGRKLKLF